MLLQPDYQCHLTQSEDVAISERVFLTEVYLNSSEEALQYKQIDQTEYERLKRQQDALAFEPTAEYYQQLDAALDVAKSKVNETAMTAAEALAVQEFFPVWGEEGAEFGKDVPVGFRLRVVEGETDTLYEVIQPHALQADWIPGTGTESLYKVVQEEHDGTQDDVKVKHRHPVKFGASVRFALTDRLGLETGLMYSLHSSDIVSGDDYGGYMTEQTLHFIGVPLNVNYSIWRTKRLEFYASAGASAELCVSGKSHTDYLSGKDIVGSTDTDQRDARPQWAVNASAGVQYDFSKLVGVYLEPGVSYYFDNGSDVRTIYKDKPFNFNLNLGVRFTIR